MKHKLIFILGLIVFGWAVFSALPAEAVTGTGGYYGNPSWDQSIPANTRFIVLTNMSNQAVLDRETGLVWQRTPGQNLWYTSNDWVGAHAQCILLSLGGRQGWRLPSIQELQSLIDPAQSNPALPAGHPFIGVQSESNIFWSSSSDANSIFLAWQLDFSNGLPFFADKDNEYRIWCVRGGSNVVIPGLGLQ